MSFYRSLAVLCAISLISGVGLCLLQNVLTPVVGRGAYAALITSAEIPDTEIRGLLTGGGADFQDIFDSVISESSQWVLLDDFSGLKQIPLNEYDERVLPIDPRNDGYASRLRSFFVRSDRRLLFIPLRSAAAVKVEKRLALLLKQIPFLVEFIGFSNPLGFFFLLFGCVGVVLFIIRFLPVRPRIELTEIYFCLPVLGAHVFYGVIGFALSALLLGAAFLLRSPLMEMWVLIRNRGRGVRLTDKVFYKRLGRDVLSPYKYNWRLAPVLIAGYFALSVWTSVSFLFSLGIFLIFMIIFGFSVLTWIRRGESRNHIRFLPVVMIKQALSPLFIIAMLPFILAAAAAGVSVSALPAADSHDLFSLQGELITEDEYLAHAAFQSSFSYRSLDTALGTAEPYPAYTLSPDNLIEPRSNKTFNFLSSEIPKYPLKDLMEFLAVRRGDKDKKK